MVRSGESINIIFVFLKHFLWLCENFGWSCEIEKHVFSTPLCNFSHLFIFNPPPPPSIQFQSLVQVHFLFLIIHIVYSPPFHFSFVTQCFKDHLKISPKLNKKPLVSLARVTTYYLGILGIITTQKVWNSWELVSKMCGFWVVITTPKAMDKRKPLRKHCYLTWKRSLVWVKKVSRRTIDHSVGLLNDISTPYWWNSVCYDIQDGDNNPN